MCIQITELSNQLTNTLDFTSNTCAVYVGSRGKGRWKENFSLHTAQACGRDKLWNLWARRLACCIQIRYQSCLYTVTVMSPCVMCTPQRIRNVVKKFCWNYTYNCRVSIWHVPVLVFHSVWMQLVPLKTMFSKPNLKTQQAPELQWTISPCLQKTVVRKFTGGSRGKTDSETPCISDDPIPLSVFMLRFAEIFAQLVVEANRYNHWCTGILDKGTSF